MKPTTFLLCTMLFYISLTNAKSQPCKDFHKSNDCYVYIPLDRDFKEYNQSKSVYTEVGKVNAFKVVLFGKKDFIVGICAGQAFYRQVRLRIFDGENGKLIYDNKDYDYIESFIFTVERTMPLFLEVTILSKDEANKRKQTCLGLEILSCKTPEPENASKKE